MSLKDKASRINFAGLPVAASPAQAQEAKLPKTAPGAMMAFADTQRSELLKENQSLQARAADADALRSRLDVATAELRAWEGAAPARLLDPRLIVRGEYANRDRASFEGPAWEQFKAELASAGGNVQPIKVRPLAGESGDGAKGQKYEVIFGHRRNQGCLELGLPVLALVEEMDDRAAFIEMERENRERAELSPWEQGMHYRRALEQGLFPSNRKLAEALGIDLSAVGKALSLASLPDTVVRAFASPLELQYRFAKPLNDAVAADPEGVCARATEIVKAGRRLGAREVFDKLTNANTGMGGGTVPPPIDVMLSSGRVATVELTAKGGAAVRINPGALKPDRLQALADMVQRFLAAQNARK